MKKISMTDRILTWRLQEKHGINFLRIRIILSPLYNGAEQKVEATAEKGLVLIES